MRKMLLAMLCLLLCCSTGMAVSPKPSTPVWQSGLSLASSCVLYVPFVEGSGTACADYSGLAHTGTAVNGTWSTGDYGAQLTCTAASSYVAFTDAADLRFTDSHTIAWLGVLTGSGAGNTAVIGKCAESGYRADVLQQFSNNMYQGWATNATTLTQEAPASFAKSDPNLDLLVVVYTPSVSVVMYQNGTPIKTSSTSIPAAFFNNNERGWKIHTRGDTIAFTPGITTGVAMWSRALSADEVATLNNDFFALVRASGNPRFFLEGE